MLLKLLGVTIATGKDRDPVVINQNTGIRVQSTEVVLRKQGAFEPETKSEVKVNFANAIHPLTKAIPWPDPGDSPWKRTMVKAAIMDFNKSAENGYFNICPFDKLRVKLHLILTEEGEFAYNQLHSLHCIDFSLMDDEVLHSIASLATAFFTTRKIIDPNNQRLEWVTKF